MRSIIDEHLKQREEDRRIQPPRILYVTQLTHPCLQQIWLGLHHDREHPIETLRIFDAGRVLEDHWVDILRKRDDIIVLSTQLPAYHYFDLEDEEWEIHGRIDILCQHNRDCLVVHEVKTAKTTHWMKEPRDAHVAQLQFYMNALGVERGQIDYLDKTSWLTGNHRIDKSFQVKADPNEYYRILQTAGQIATAVKKAKVPEANPNAWNGKVCNYCNYQDLCEKENE